MIKKINNLLYSLVLFFSSLFLSILLTLNFPPLYYLSINFFNLTSTTGLSTTALMNDYLKLIEYLKNPCITTLKLNNFPISHTGYYHFEEVKNIFLLIHILFILFILIGILLLYLNTKEIFILSINSLNYFFYISLIPIVILLIGFTLNFSKIFDGFHNTFFDNDYWIFNSLTDPIILALPEKYFMLCTIIILLILLSIAIISKIIYSKFKNK